MHRKKEASVMEKSSIQTKEACEKIIFAIAARLEKNDEKISNRDLLKICTEETNLPVLNFEPHFFHEVAETALNFLIKTKYADLSREHRNKAEFCRKILRPLVNRLPTQTWRSQKQIIRQQFSTPPALAYLLTWLINPQEKETVLEPSAGTGNLLVWSKPENSRLLVNEIDTQRCVFLEALGFRATRYNAEFINDFPAPEITVDVLLINPPFSANGGRTKNSSKYGFRHVASALERLRAGGKFGIILGEAGGLDTKTGREFWQKNIEQFNVKANIKLSGREYYKNGTTVDVNLIFGEKLSEPRQVEKTKTVNQIPFFTADTVEVAFDQTTTHNLRFNR